MKSLRPESREVVAVYVISWSSPGDDVDTHLSRRYYLGLFEPGVTEESVLSAISENQVRHLVMASASLSGESPVKVGIIRRKITEGVWFDSPDEACQYLSRGISFDDIMDGYGLSSGEDPF